MKIELKNVGGVAEAQIESDGIILVTGRNAQGKSILLRAVASALVGDPLLEFTKRDAPDLVRDGATGGWVRVQQEKSETTIEWPQCRFSTTGPKLESSIFAAGVASIATMPARERAVALEPYLKSSPTREDLDKVMTENFSQKIIDDLWGRIETDGWDATHRHLITSRAKTAGSWEQVTKEHFGSQKALSWKPEGWRPGLDDYDDAELERRVAAARGVLDEALKHKTLEEAEIQRLRALAAAMPDKERALDDWTQKNSTANETLMAALKERSRLPETTAGAETGLPCPHCGAFVKIMRDLATTTLEKFVEIPKADLKRIRREIAEADGTVSKLQSEYQATITPARRAAEDLAEARMARQAIAELENEEHSGTGVPLETARDHLATAENDLRIVMQLSEAEQLAARWSAQDQIAQILDPTGLRQTKLAEGLQLFNKTHMAELSTISGWGLVEVGPDMVTRYEAPGKTIRRYSLVSESEQLRVRILLQVAQAKLDGSALVIIDRADQLDNVGRNELFKLLSAPGMPNSLVAMTLSRPGLAPDLSKHHLGLTAWIEGGHARLLSDVMAPTA